MKIIKSLEKFAYKIAYSHNWVHYAAARLLGIQVSKDNWVWINDEWPIWKNIIIYIAPTFLGVIVVVGSFIGNMRWFYSMPLKYVFGAGFILGCSWLGICFIDYLNVIHFLIFRRWLE